MHTKRNKELVDEFIEAIIESIFIPERRLKANKLKTEILSRMSDDKQPNIIKLKVK